MRVKEEKIFMDSVHGYISIPKCFVKYIIDTDYFQRLRNIDQTGMRILFPNAKHDRFSHSLGVFYLGRKAILALWNNSRHMIVEKEKNTSNEKFNKEDWKRNEVLFLLACLLHDIGHTPFSHALEDLVFNNTLKNSLDINEELKERLGEEICGASHEKMGAYLLFSDFFQGQIKKVLLDLSNEEYYKGIFEHDGESIEDYLCFMARMIIGLRYDMEKNNDDSYALRNCFIELLNGSNFDVDNLDYIVRDTQMSGIQNVTVDIDRLFNSLCIVTKTIYQGIDIKSEFPVSKKETIVEGENEGHNVLIVEGNFAGAILIQPNTKVTIGKDSYFTSLADVSNGSVKISLESNESVKFENHTEIEIDSEKISISYDLNSYKRIYPKNNRTPFYCKIQNAKTITDFIFTAKEETILMLKNKCTLEIAGAFQVFSSISVQNAKVFPQSRIDKIAILDKKENTTKNLAKNKRIEYAIGFRKQAINIIANVLEARNYLYLWIYAHHKVVYYANFLIPVLAKKLFQFDLKSKIWELEYNSLRYLDDCYFWTMIKEVNCKQNEILSNDNKLQREIAQLIQELMERKYKCSVYKSLAEFDLFFEQITDEQMREIVNILQEKTDEKMPNLEKDKKNDYIAGYLHESFINEVNKELEDMFPMLQLKNLLYVCADYKMKTLNTEQIYINMGDKVVTMEDIYLLEKHSQVNEQKRNYFYFYYETEMNGTESKGLQVKINSEEIQTSEELEKIYKTELSEAIREVLIKKWRGDKNGN